MKDRDTTGVDPDDVPYSTRSPEPYSISLPDYTRGKKCKVYDISIWIKHHIIKIYLHASSDSKKEKNSVEFQAYLNH